jgi:hypothetical protein
LEKHKQDIFIFGYAIFGVHKLDKFLKTSNLKKKALLLGRALLIG